MGSRKGIPNKASAQRAAAIARSGLTPLDYMLKVMRNDKAPPERRDEMAKAAAPYVHPKLAAVEHTGKGGAPLMPQQLDPIEYAKRIAFLLAQGLAKSTGEVAP